MKHYKTTTLNKNGEKQENIAGATAIQSFRPLDVTLDQPLGFKPWFLLWTLLTYSSTILRLVLHFIFLIICMRLPVLEILELISTKSKRNFLPFTYY